APDGILRLRARLQLLDHLDVVLVHLERALDQVEVGEQRDRGERELLPHTLEIASGSLGFGERHLPFEAALAGEREVLAELNRLPEAHVARERAQGRDLVHQHRIVERGLLWKARQRGAGRLARGFDRWVSREHCAYERLAGQWADALVERGDRLLRCWVGGDRLQLAGEFLVSGLQGRAGAGGEHRGGGDEGEPATAGAAPSTYWVHG